MQNLGDKLCDARLVVDHTLYLVHSGHPYAVTKIMLKIHTNTVHTKWVSRYPQTHNQSTPTEYKQYTTHFSKPILVI